jgi:hypothetical protein
LTSVNFSNPNFFVILPDTGTIFGRMDRRRTPMFSDRERLNLRIDVYGLYIYISRHKIVRFGHECLTKILNLNYLFLVYKTLFKTQKNISLSFSLLFIFNYIFIFSINSAFLSFHYFLVILLWFKSRIFCS